MSDHVLAGQALAALQARAAELEADLSASRRTVEVLVARIQREQRAGGTDRRACLQAIGQLETTVAARQRDLAQREEYYRALFHQSPDAILALDEQGIVLSCNRTAELTFGQDLARLVGQPVTTLVSAESGASLMGLLWSGFSGVGGAELVAPRGRLLAFSVARLSPTEVLLVLRDVTERRRLEDALEGARRYAGYGRLAAELAAEITNPLSVVLGRLELLRQRPPASTRQLLPVLEVLAEHCRRIDATVGNLRALGKPRLPHPEPVALADLVARAVAHSAPRLRRVRLSVDIPDDIIVIIDPDHGELALRDLMLTLADAMPSDRTLDLRLDKVDRRSIKLRIRGEQAQLPPAVVSALGQPQHDRAAPMDPGLGLGLAIAGVLLRDNGGGILAQQDATGQIDLVLSLPAQTGPMFQDGAIPVILVVDDDHLLCETVSWMLSGQGLRVRTTPTAEDALRLLSGRHFDDVLADLLLPGMDGLAFLTEVERRWPEMAGHLVLTTGSDFAPGPDKRLLRKPFDRDQLMAALRLDVPR